MPERVRWDAKRHPTHLARMVHAGWVHRLLSAADGRQMPGPDSDSVSLKCERIIEQLTLLGIRYVREPADSERGAQDVRPLNEVLSWRLATCLDMCVTFCCAALDAGVYPMILTLKRGEQEHRQRHAIVLVPVKASWSVGCPIRLEEGFTREPFLDDGFPIITVPAPGRAGSWLAIDVQQATTPPGGSPGDWAKALAKGTEYLRTWQWDVCVDVGGLRATTMLDDASAPEVRDPSGILLPGYLPLAEGATPLQLLRTRSGVVPFCSRRELNQLRDWACATGGTTEDSDNAGTDLAVALVTGAGGCGKTRLAAELCHNLSTLGWCAGFLPARADLSDADLAEFSKLTTELLIVVDYAEESRQEQLRRLLRALAARRSPTRLVLTSRGADVWWEQFQENMEEDGVRLGVVLPMRLEQRLDDPDVPDVPGLLYRRAAHAFAKAMGSSVPADLPSPEREGRTTLDIVLQAWLTALPKQEDDTEKIDVEKLPPTRDNLYDRVLEVEFGRWREEARDSGLTIISKVHHRRAAAVLTMLAPAPDAEAVDEVLSRLPEWSNEHLLRSRYAELLEETLLRGAGDGGVALQPDPVAEHLVLQVCRKAPELLDEVLPQDPLTVPGLEDPEADDLVVARALALGEQAERCCAVITRAADLDQERALSLARRALAARPHLWHVALHVSLAQGGSFAQALEELVTSGADLPLAEIHEAIPLGHSWLRDLGVAVAQRLETLAGDEPAQRAQALNNLAVRLSEAGRRGEALGVFVTNTEYLSSAARAYLLLARARWRGSEGAEDVVAAAQEANKDDDPQFLGPCRREIAAALREHGLTNEDLPVWATVIVDKSLRQRLETWLNCDSPAEQATYLESEWNSPTPSDCETLDALTDLFIDVPPISVLHQYVTQIKSHGIDEIASLLRNQDLAITLTKDWLAEHRRGRGGQYLRNHPTLLTDSRLADLVPQALANLTSADEAAVLTALLDLARLSDPEIAYAVTSADDADDALADLLGRGKWRAILAALVLNPSLADQASLGVLAEVLRAAAAGETGKAEVRLRGARESVSSFHIEQLRLLLSQALLHGDCPSGFSDLLDVLNDSSRASSS